MRATPISHDDGRVSSGRGSAIVKLATLAAIVLLAWLLARELGVFERVSAEGIGETIRSAREFAWAAPLFVAVYAVAATLGLPGTALTLAGGAIFGVWLGTALNWLGATLGAMGAFFVARLLGADAVRSLLGGHSAKLDRLAANASFTGLLRLRLIPVIPFNALNFGSGLAGLKTSTYAAATAIGILPGTAVYTWFADSLIAGVEGARQEAFVRVAIAAAALIALSFTPWLARRLGWIGPAALLLAFTTANAQEVDHGDWDRMLKAHVTNGLVDYDAFERDARFAPYLARLDSVRPERLPEKERLAYWINVYNAYTIELINSRDERKSIRNINKVFGIPVRSPWAEPMVRAGGRTLTLDDVEHEIIRKEFDDPRIHVALVCAAIGCPPLREEAYVSESLDAQLDDQARRFLQDTSKNRVDVATRTVHGSPIFTWYREDFTDLRGVGRFWSRYFPEGPRRALLESGEFTWKDTDYDWSLNIRRAVRLKRDGARQRPASPGSGGE